MQLATVPMVSDSLTLYLQEIKRFPVLSAADEHRLAVRLRDENDLAAAETLITSNLRFVVKIAYEYRAYGLKMLDLIQEGNVGLMLAVRKFDPDKGVRLITYAVWWIRAYIQNYILSAWSLLKIGTTQAQRKLFFKFNQARQAIRQLTGNEDDLPATAAYLEVTPEEAAEMQVRLQGECSLDAELAGGEGLTLLDTLADERQNQEELLADAQEEAQRRSLVGSALERLSDKERFVVEQRVSAEEPLTLQEIADHFAISRERVRQIEENALRKLRQTLQPLLPVNA